MQPLETLAAYLERALDKAASIVMIRHTADVCTVYIGDPAGPKDELKRIHSISNLLADKILESTSSGANRTEINGQTYRFVRSFTQVEDLAAVVFKPA
ncbi:putative uncharacterized protein [Caballeronia insecticola]|uniref:Uncharacterized protein n=1 Tax=Caballeronia insecticola TaxID=758793 RepID=R4X2C2_9BURK|nr:putative uncharacterized protein [Caballeronia insecticola]